MQISNGRAYWGAALAVCIVAACSDPGAPEALDVPPSFGGTGTTPPTEFVLCKEGTGASFTYAINGGAANAVTLATGEANPGAEVSVTEDADPSIQLDSIVRVVSEVSGSVTRDVFVGTSTVSGFVGDDATTVTFFNQPVSSVGRMTGGGGQIILGDVRVTRGFTIHCDITLSNNLEVNWPDNRWHIDKPLTSAQCIDDPSVDPEPPAAPFDTFIGEGIGRLNDVDGSAVRFTFVDSGEPGGKQDKASVQIWAPGADPNSATPVQDVPLSVLDHGNLQAHFDQPHGNKPN